MYHYRFELSDFEQGHFIATRFVDAGLERLPGDWVVSAKNEHHALELAKRAAMRDWPKPRGRGALDFVVKFVDPASLSAAPSARR